MSAGAGSKGGRGIAYAGTLLGLSASLAANVLHVAGAPVAAPHAAYVGALVWPLALLISTEVLMRKRWASPTARMVGAAAVGAVAVMSAVISYAHVQSVLADQWKYGPWSSALGPLVIDGLMVVCALALVTADAPTQGGEGAPAGAPAVVEVHVDAPAPVPAPMAALGAPAPPAPAGAPAAPDAGAGAAGSGAPTRRARKPSKSLEECAREVREQGLHGASARGLARALGVSQKRAGEVLRAMEAQPTLGVVADGRA